MGTSGLGALLVEEGLLTENDRRTIRRTSGTQGAAFARSILAMGLMNEDELATFLVERTRFLRAGKDLMRQAQKSALAAVDPPLLAYLHVAPLRFENDTLVVAMPDPLDRDTVNQLEFFTGYKIQPVVATFSQVRSYLQRMLPNYQYSTHPIEAFLQNHAEASLRQQRLHDPRTSSRKPQLRTPAPPPVIARSTASHDRPIPQPVVAKSAIGKSTTTTAANPLAAAAFGLTSNQQQKPNAATLEENNPLDLALDSSPESDLFANIDIDTDHDSLRDTTQAAKLPQDTTQSAKLPQASSKEATSTDLESTLHVEQPSNELNDESLAEDLFAPDDSSSDPFADADAAALAAAEGLDAGDSDGIDASSSVDDPAKLIEPSRRQIASLEKIADTPELAQQPESIASDNSPIDDALELIEEAAPIASEDLAETDLHDDVSEDHAALAELELPSQDAASAAFAIDQLARQASVPEADLANQPEANLLVEDLLEDKALATQPLAEQDLSNSAINDEELAETSSSSDHDNDQTVADLSQDDANMPQPTLGEELSFEELPSTTTALVEQLQTDKLLADQLLADATNDNLPHAELHESVVAQVDTPLVEQVDKVEAFAAEPGNEQPSADASFAEQQLDETTELDHQLSEELINDELATGEDNSPTPNSDDTQLEPVAVQEQMPDSSDNEQLIAEPAFDDQLLEDIVELADQQGEELLADTLSDDTNSSLAPINDAALLEPVTAQAHDTENPISQAATADEPVSQTLTTDDPVSQAATADEPVSQAATTDNPVSQAVIADEPVSQAVIADEPVSQAVIADEPVSKQQTAEHLSSEAPSTDQDTSVEQTDDKPMLEPELAIAAGTDAPSASPLMSFASDALSQGDPATNLSASDSNSDAADELSLAVTDVEAVLAPDPKEGFEHELLSDEFKLSDTLFEPTFAPDPEPSLSIANDKPAAVEEQTPPTVDAKPTSETGIPARIESELPAASVPSLDTAQEPAIATALDAMITPANGPFIEADVEPSLMPVDEPTIGINALPEKSSNFAEPSVNATNARAELVASIPLVFDLPKPAAQLAQSADSSQDQPASIEYSLDAVDLDTGDLDTGDLDAGDLDTGDLDTGDPLVTLLGRHPNVPHQAGIETNRALLAISLASSTAEAADALVPALIANGLSWGILISLPLTGSPSSLGTWHAQHSARNLASYHLDQSTLSSIKASLSASPSAWQFVKTLPATLSLPQINLWLQDKQDSQLLVCQFPSEQQTQLLIIAATSVADQAMLKRQLTPLLRKLLQQMS